MSDKKKSDLITRVVTALIGVAIFFIIIFSGDLVIGLALAAITVMMLYELYKAFKFNIGLSLFGYFGAVGTVCLCSMGHMDQFFGFLTAYVIILSVMAVLFNKKISFNDVCHMIFATLYITSTIVFLLLIRKKDDSGLMCLVLVFAIAWVTDTSAYFGGRFFGKHKLIPAISPKKTVEGAIGGVVGAVVIGCGIYALVMKYVFAYNINYISLFALGVIGAVAAQFGDLIASLIKRSCNVKDFGSIMPGHGGILDRFDSVLLVAVVVYFFLEKFPIFI